MALRVVAIVFAIVGLYFDLWHSPPLPFNHFQVFGRGFGAQHSIHAFIGLILIVAAYWLWMRARAMSAEREVAPEQSERIS